MKKQILKVLEGTHHARIMPEVVLVERLGLSHFDYIHDEFEKSARNEDYKTALKQLESEGLIVLHGIIKGVGVALNQKAEQ